MISRVADRVTERLVADSIIEESDKALYSYGFFLIISRFYFFLVTVLAGFLNDVLCESLVFYVAFMFLRTYAGGIHAKTEIACTILTSIVLVASVFLIKIMVRTNNNGACFLMFLIGSLPVFLFAPLDSKDKPVTHQERIAYRFFCNLLLMFFWVIFIFAQILSHNTVCYAISISIGLEGTLICIGKISNQNNK